ncbi:hypothetical protein GCM10007147_16300 [Nocardiopsis kunsanensis]|uniref:Uncharacterized protein n=1 Tax=Nocardiopsis kunsanensis TaxID=141693 RepID=A0A919CGJ9_9ACTN|nr:hypothetical protein GCM10007147_16300 [Nocardiopsis kunsanensis]
MARCLSARRWENGPWWWVPHPSAVGSSPRRRLPEGVPFRLEDGYIALMRLGAE